MGLGIAVLRAIVGALFIGHGLQKLAGKFGGHGLDGTAGFFEALGLRPGKVHATAAGVAEAGGGALLALGAATPLAASALTGTMAVAIEKVHLQKGPWVTDGGYEYNAVLMAAVFAITAAGPGPLSLDRRTWGEGWALAQLAAGVAGGLAMSRLATSAPEPAAPDVASGEPVAVPDPGAAAEASDVAEDGPVAVPDPAAPAAEAEASEPVPDPAAPEASTAEPEATADSEDSSEA